MMEYGLLGEKLSHSFSKEIHETIAEYTYELIEVAPEALDVFMKERQFKAINVTIPYKQKVIPYLDEMTEAARLIGAVNCIRNENGKLIGHNTDYDGMLGLLRHADVTLSGKKVLILGTGGTSDTALAVCDKLGAEYAVKVGRSEKLGSVTYAQAEIDYADAQIILNTTPCGMYPNLYEQPICLEPFKRLEAVIDVIYNPLQTALVLDAKQRKLKAEGGLYMLVEQAVKASAFFLDTNYDSQITDQVYEALFVKKQNIVLTGMPSCGKTTVGKLLANHLNRPFYDTDDLIEAKSNKKITEIFETYGEAYFRDLETEAIKEVALKNGCVIATGGGAVLRQENVDALKQNGTVFFIDRELQSLMPTKDRPTASSIAQIRQRYEERYPIYTATCDFVIPHQNTAECVMDAINKELFL